jgi:hypothetical protein
MGMLKHLARRSGDGNANRMACPLCLGSAWGGGRVPGHRFLVGLCLSRGRGSRSRAFDLASLPQGRGTGREAIGNVAFCAFEGLAFEIRWGGTRTCNQTVMSALNPIWWLEKAGVRRNV